MPTPKTDAAFNIVYEASKTARRQAFLWYKGAREAKMDQAKARLVLDQKLDSILDMLREIEYHAWGVEAAGEIINQEETQL